jgi:hypothetical protein
MVSKRSSVNWNNIAVKVVPVDKGNPNKLNPYSGISDKEREQTFISACGKIWARHIRDRQNKQSERRQ